VQTSTAVEDLKGLVIDGRKGKRVKTKRPNPVKDSAFSIIN
jgi:hypothetical protein